MAQERKKRRIVLASILKPVDDTRMFEKMGVSLAAQDEYEVFIVGFPAFSPPSFTGILFFPLQKFPRLSFQRWFAKWKVFAKVWKIQPSVLIFNTHELILPAIILKICLNVLIVYDVRENYYRNILHTDSFPWFIRIPLALLVRWKEKLTAPAIDHFFLAEKGYENEFRFHRGGWTVIENKSSFTIPLTSQARPVKSTGNIKLLFSGTLSETTGVFRAIQLARELHTLDPLVSLTIIGYAALEKTRTRIQKEAKGRDYIELMGIDRLVPHQEIISAIQSANFGIIAYPDSPHTRNSHPTKLFEYLSGQLPIIGESHWPWVERYRSCEPFIFIDFSNPDYAGLLHDIRTQKTYTQTPENVTWASEEAKLVNAISEV